MNKHIFLLLLLFFINGCKYLENESKDLKETVTHTKESHEPSFSSEYMKDSSCPDNSDLTLFKYLRKFSGKNESWSEGELDNSRSLYYYYIYVYTDSFGSVGALHYGYVGDDSVAGYRFCFDEMGRTRQVYYSSASSSFPHLIYKLIYGKDGSIEREDIFFQKGELFVKHVENSEELLESNHIDFPSTKYLMDSPTYELADYIGMSSDYPIRYSLEEIMNNVRSDLVLSKDLMGVFSEIGDTEEIQVLLFGKGVGKINFSQILKNYPDVPEETSNEFKRRDDAVPTVSLDDKFPSFSEANEKFEISSGE